MRLSFDWEQFNAPEQDFGAFRLQLNLSKRVRRLRGVVDFFTVYDVLDCVAIANHFLPVPLPDWLLYVLLATKANLIFPIRIASIPVEAAAIPSHLLSASMPDELVFRSFDHFGRQRWLIASPDHDEVAAPA